MQEFQSTFHFVDFVSNLWKIMLLKSPSKGKCTNKCVFYTCFAYREVLRIAVMDD